MSLPTATPQMMLMFSIWLVPPLVLTHCGREHNPSLCWRSAKPYSVPFCTAPPVLRWLAISHSGCGFDKLLLCSGMWRECLGSGEIYGQWLTWPQAAQRTLIHKPFLWHLAPLFPHHLHYTGKVQDSCFEFMPESASEFMSEQTCPVCCLSIKAAVTLLPQPCMRWYSKNSDPSIVNKWRFSW